MKVETYEITDRAQWLEWRKRDVTASDIAAVCGFSRQKTALQVALEKAGEIGPIADNNLMRRGRWLESSVLAAMQDEVYEGIVVPAGKTYWRVPRWRIGCTPDAFFDDPLRGRGIVQAKVASRTAFDKWEEGSPPLDYALQTLCECMVTGSPYGVLAVLVIDEFTAEIVTYPVERHPVAEQTMRDRVKDFWSGFRAGKLPEIDLDRDKNLLAKVLPPKKRTRIALTNPTIPELIEERETLRGLRKAYKERIDQIDTLLIRDMSTAEVGEAGDYEVHYSLRHVGEHVVAASTSPVLRIKKRRGI